MNALAKRLAVVVIAGTMVACASPTASPSASEPASADTGLTSEKLAADLVGLSPEAREQHLLELALEAGPISLYADTQLDNSAELLDAFGDKYDLEVSIYDGSTDSVRDRLLQEAEAGYRGADVVELDALGMYVVSQAKLLAPVETPLAEAVGAAGRFPDWTAIRYSFIVTGWNTGGVDVASAPRDFRDLAKPEWSGRLGLEGSDVYWFAAIVKHYQATEGMTEEAAVDVFRQVAANAQVTSGHTATADFLLAGQFDASPNVYAHQIMQRIEDGAPVDWQPATQPVVAEPTGIALLKSAKNPAGAQLYIDWILSPEGGQAIFVGQSRIPSHLEVAKTVVGDVQPIEAAFDEIAAEYDKWNTLWDEIVRGS
jgi:iron(III) transport system substrate-binding protein